MIESTKQTLCLNMIVKDESHIIHDTLTKLCNKVQFDYWVISDTGSTDNTPQIIGDFFKERNIPGELCHDTWQNFAHNRTKALEHAYNKTDQLFIFDADDELVGDLVIPNPLKYDGYLLNFGPIFKYSRMVLINNRKRWKFLSPVHEFITCESDPLITQTTLDGDYHIVSGKSGTRSKDPDKYLNDARLLKREFEKTSRGDKVLMDRYAYYCAQSYRDAGRPKHAIKWFLKVLEINGWWQEKYMACINLHQAYDQIGEIERGLYYLTRAVAYDWERVEWLNPLLQHYHNKNQDNVAFGYYSIIKDWYENRYLDTKAPFDNKLHSDISLYDFYIPNQMILIADKVKEYGTVLAMFVIVFTKKYRVTNPQEISNLLYNFQFFIKHIDDFELGLFSKMASEYIRFVHENKLCNLSQFDWLEGYSKWGIDVSCVFPKPNFSKEECQQSKNIIIYTGFSNEDWNISYMQHTALGGSEKAAIYVAQNLAQLLPDWHIYISGGVESETINNITFIHYTKLTELATTIPFHTAIVSRYVALYDMFPKLCFNQSFIWAHDTCLISYGSNLTSEQLVKKYNKNIDGCICLTEWQKKEYINIYPQLKDKIFLNNNGIIPNLFPQNIVKIPNSFVYTSCAERGLTILLDLWPQILERLPDATLKIASYNEFPKNEDEQRMKSIIDSHNSIQHLGKLSPTLLYQLMAESEYWLYPCTWPETSCITALEMLMSGCVCLYYPYAGLTDTMGGHGIQISRGNEIDTLMSLTNDQKDKMREHGKEYALSCSWANRAEVWRRLIIEKDKYELELYLEYLHRDFSIPNDHIKYLHKLRDEDNFVPKVIYDIGSSTLHWTKEAEKVWPRESTEIICFDATPNVEFMYKKHGHRYHIGVISDVDNKEVKFWSNDKWLGGNSMYKEQMGPNPDYFFPEENYKIETTTTLLTIVNDNSFPDPDLIKIDVQGAELDILMGSMNIINKAKYLIVELQDQPYNRGAPLAPVTIKFLEANGWKIKDAKFSDNGPDADTCFINMRYF